MTTTNEVHQQDVLVEIIPEMDSYLQRITDGCGEVSLLLQTSEQARGLSGLAEILEGLNYYEKMLKSAMNLLQIDSAAVLTDSASQQSFSESFMQTAQELCEAAGNDDYSLAADLVQYDLQPLIGQAREILTVIGKKVTERVRVDAVK